MNSIVINKELLAVKSC